MTKLAHITSAILASSFLIGCGAAEQDAYRWGGKDVSYAMDLDGEQYVKVSVSAIKETSRETEAGYETQLKAYVTVKGREGFGQYVLYADQTFAWDAEQPVTSLSLNRIDGRTTWAETSFDGRTVAAEYVRGDMGLKTGFDHVNTRAMLDHYRTYGTLSAAELELGIEPDPRWAGHPLQDVMLSAMAQLQEHDRTSIDVRDLRDATAMYASQTRADLKGDPDPAVEMTRELTAKSDEEIATTVKTPPADCTRPTAAKVDAQVLDGSAYGLTAHVQVEEISVNALKTTQVGGLTASAASGGGISLGTGDASDCPDADWNIGEKKIVGDVEATAEITCSQTTCCPNGVEDQATTMSVQLKLGNEGIDITGTSAKADGISGAAAVKGTSWLCYDEDLLSGNDYLGSGYSIRFLAKIDQIDDIDVPAELAKVVPKQK